MRLAAIVLLLWPIAVAAGTRDLTGESCGVCVFTLCLGSKGYYEPCADPCAAEVVVRLGSNDADRERLLPVIGRGKKRTRLRCHGLGAPCPVCGTDGDCRRTDPSGIRGLCVQHTCQYVCPSGLVLSFD
jgi:hypothetical protein